MLYQNYEIQTSQMHLSKVVSNMSSICILGGWAVHITVNKNFVESQGREYIGSKDIDVGFHINKNWSGNELKESDFARSIHALECTGFRRLSFRLVKYFHTETQKELNEQQIRELNQHLMFCLYVDPVVDAIHPKTMEILGFIPIDEHLLFYVFEKRKYTMIDSLDGKVMLPLPEVLAATKIKAIPSRDKEHKRIKRYCRSLCSSMVFR